MLLRKRNKFGLSAPAAGETEDVTLPVDDLEVSYDELEQVVAATKMVGALIAESLVDVRPAITAAQWRVLVLSSDGGCNVSSIAEDLGVHRSNASRVCDRLVRAGLLCRRRSDQDKRHVLLALTPAGRRLFNSAMEYRRRRLEEAMGRMTEAERADLARCFTRLVECAAEVKLTQRSAG
jgi:DNA-binding MarR family transcriptional regulator